VDPWGQAFDDMYEPQRAKRAGQQIAGGWKFVLAGFQGDADFISHLFFLEKSLDLRHVKNCQSHNI
jgi:hypothetical protein